MKDLWTTFLYISRTSQASIMTVGFLVHFRWGPTPKIGIYTEPEVATKTTWRHKIRKMSPGKLILWVLFISLNVWPYSPIEWAHSPSSFCARPHINILWRCSVHTKQRTGAVCKPNITQTELLFYMVLICASSIWKSVERTLLTLDS